MISERPIFIVGAQRSGTTLLRYILSSHPQIYIPPESNFIPRYFGQGERSTFSRERAVEIVEGILGYSTFFKDWKLNLPDAEKVVDSSPDLTPGEIINTLYTEYASQYGSTRWGDKSPIYSDYMDLIQRIFPNAQFIHIIRDGRDVSVSMLKTYHSARFFYVDLYYAAEVWKQRVIMARRSGQRMGQSNYYELHYEDLTANPEEEIRKICEYLDEKFDNVMTEPYSVAKMFYHSKGIHSNTRKPLNTDSVGRWKVAMSDQDQRLFQSVACDLLRELGYEVRDLGSQSVSELIRLMVLMTKFHTIQSGKRLTKSVGVFHPTDILSRYLEPYPNKGG